MFGREFSLSQRLQGENEVCPVHVGTVGRSERRSLADENHWRSRRRILHARELEKAMVVSDWLGKFRGRQPGILGTFLFSCFASSLIKQQRQKDR